MNALDPGGIVVLRTTGSARATKEWRWSHALGEWSRISFQGGAHFTAEQHQVADLDGLAALLERLRRDPSAFVVRGALAPETAAAVATNPQHRIRRRKLIRNGEAPTLVEAARQWIMVDIDDWPLRVSDDLAADPASAVDHAIQQLLPPEFHDTECWWQLSSSAGFVPGVLKCHIWFWLSEPVTNDHLLALMKQVAPGADPALYNSAQVHYVADPVIVGGYDPIPVRTGRRKGLEQAVILPALLPPRPRNAQPGIGTIGRPRGPLMDDLRRVLGDGDGREGFHKPLRAATMRYAKEAARHGDRNDDATIQALVHAVSEAPAAPGRNLADYGPHYLSRLINGAFEVLGGQDDIIAPRAQHTAASHTVAEVRFATATAISKTIDRALDWHRLDEAAKIATPPQHAAVMSGVGSGKSRAGYEDVRRFVNTAKAEGLPHRVLWLIDTHKLSDEALAKMQALGVSAAVLRGREADVPGTGDPENCVLATRMCLNLDAVTDAVTVMANVEDAACGSGKPGKQSCPWRSSEAQCCYQAQKPGVARAEVVIAAHQALLHELPKEAREGIGLVVVDESFWQAGLNAPRDLIVNAFAGEPVGFPVLMPSGQRGAPHIPNEAMTRDLCTLSAMAAAAFERTQAGDFLALADIKETELTTDDCTRAIKLEWQRKVDGVLLPGMSPATRKERIALAMGNAAIPRRVAAWKAIRDLLTGEDTHTGRLQGGTHPTPGGGVPCIIVNSRRDILDKIASLPMLLMDATLPLKVVEHFLPRLEVLTDVRAAEPHTRVVQVLGGWGKTTLCPNPAAPANDPENRRRAKTVRQLMDYVRLHGGARPLVITYKDIESKFEQQGFLTLHFGAVCGLDGFGDVTAVFIIGRPLPDAYALLAMALALTGRPIKLEQPRNEVRGIQMTDGTVKGVNVRAYADPDLEALRAAITDTAIIQAGGRGRGVNRDADSPLGLFIMADVASPLPVDELVRWEDVRPDRVASMVGRGLVLTSGQDAAIIYPDLYETRKAAVHALAREGAISAPFPYGDIFIGEWGGNQPLQVRYKPAGRGQQWRSAWVRADRLDGLPAFLSEKLHSPVEVQSAPAQAPQQAPVPQPVVVPVPSPARPIRVPVQPQEQPMDNPPDPPPRPRGTPAPTPRACDHDDSFQPGPWHPVPLELCEGSARARQVAHLGRAPDPWPPPLPEAEGEDGPDAEVRWWSSVAAPPQWPRRV